MQYFVIKRSNAFIAFRNEWRLTRLMLTTFSLCRACFERKLVYNVQLADNEGTQWLSTSRGESHWKLEENDITTDGSIPLEHTMYATNNKAFWLGRKVVNLGDWSPKVTPIVHGTAYCLKGEMKRPLRWRFTVKSRQNGPGRMCGFPVTCICKYGKLDTDGRGLNRYCELTERACLMRLHWGNDQTVRMHRNMLGGWQQ